MRYLALAYACLLCACGGGASEPPVDNTPVAVTITPTAGFTMQSGATTTLVGTVTAAGGQVVTGAAVSWSSSDQSVVSVSSSGLATAAKVGETTVRATSGSAQGFVSITVTPGPARSLAIRQQPVGATIGSPLSTQPIVEFHDQAGNVATSSDAFIVATISSGGGTLGGTTGVLSVAGVTAFSDLRVSGISGPRTLTFTAGILSVTSTSFAMTQPAAPRIVVDSSNVTFTTGPGLNPAPRTLTVLDDGAAAFTTVTADSIAYDLGQIAGWLSTSLNGTVSPLSLTLSVTSAKLAPGNYHATVRVAAAGAVNTPTLIGVTLTVVPTFAITYGSPTGKIALLDPGGTFTPTVSVTNNGAPQPSTGVIFTSRSPSTAMVDASGKVTGVGGGQAWIVAEIQGALDSVFVVVTRSKTSPVLRSDLTTYIARSGDALTVTFFLDPRAVSVGAATVTIGYETFLQVFANVTATVPTQTPMPIANLAATGVYKVTVASATGITAPIPLLTLSFTTRNPGNTAWIDFSILDATDVGGVDISRQVSSTRYPITVR